MTEKQLTAGKPAEDFIRIQDLWGMFVPKWRWFLLSVFVCVAIAVLYLLSTAPVYTRSASLLVKEDPQNSTSNMASNFSDFGLFKSNTNINNELHTIQSPTLMAEVVRRLNLDETYTIRKGLRKINLYKASPVMVSFRQKPQEPVSFTIELSSDKEFTLSDLKVGKEDVDGSFTGHIGDSIRTSAGTLTLLTTPHYSKEFIGKSIRYVKGDFNIVTDAYTKALRADLTDEKATIINLAIDDASIQKAEDILNTLIEVYNEMWVLDKNQMAISTSHFIGDRLGVIENELGHVDENISNYKSEHLLPDVQAASSLYMTQSAETKKELLTLNAQLSTAQYIRAELDKKKLDQPLPSSSGFENDNISKMLADYNAMVLDRNRLLANSSEKNPLVKDLTEALLSSQKNIIQSVDNLIVSLNAQIGSLRKQETTTVNQLASNPTQAKYLLSVERQQKVKEELYLYLLQKREENELSQAFTAYNTRVITSPRGTMIPTAPKKMSVLLMAFVLGLLLPAVTIFIKETLNTKVRGRKDLEALSIPLLGEIPQNKQSAKDKRSDMKHINALVVKEGNRDIINEAFRVLRSNVDFMVSGENRQKVLLTTSFNPGSGKSFLTLNLAMTFAIRRKRVLLIDGDFRHASISSFIHSPKRGISDYLGRYVTDIKDIIYPFEASDYLQVIPVGTLPPNPAELLENGMFATLIDQVRDQYDYIFIDCPPIDIVADTQIIEKLADRTIFVVRAGLLDRAMLPTLESIYQEKRFKNMSLILNGTEMSGTRYGYQYGYHYGYGAGYSYGNPDKN